MIRSKTTTANAALDGLTILGYLTKLRGSEVQTYRESTGEYEDDRRLIPCVLMGAFGVSDPAGIVDSLPIISGIEWYDGEPQKLADGSDDLVTHRIKNPASIPADPSSVDYLISDGSDAEWCQGVPEFGLIIHKNVEMLTTQPIYAVIKFLDTRTGTTVRKLCSTNLTCEYGNDLAMTVVGDHGEAWVMDPIGIREPLTAGNDVTAEPWLRTYGAQLRQIGENIPDSKACYLWVVRDKSVPGEWREFNASETGTLLRSAANGKQLTLDLRYAGSNLTIRCYANQREEGDEWSNPVGDGNPYYECRINVELNRELDARITQTAGYEQSMSMDTPCSFSLSMVYGNKTVADNKLGLFSVTWRAVNLQTFATVTLGTGMSVTFTPADKGFSYTYGFGVYAEVRTFMGIGSGGSVTYGTNITARSKTIRWAGKIEGLSIYGQLCLLQGSTTQVYTESDGEYPDDRRLTPCVLMGAFSVFDPQGAVPSAPSVTGIEWYDGVPQKLADGSDDYDTHRIKNPASIPADPSSVDYLISDGSDAAWCQGVPEWGLIIHKNVEILTTQPIYAVIKFLDTRTGTTVRKLCSINLNTEYLNDGRFSVSGDHGEEYVLDPLGIREPLTADDVTKEPWLRTLTAQARSGGEELADSETSYLWVRRDSSVAFGWREFDDNEKEVMLYSDPKTRTLTIDMRFVGADMPVRCYARRRNQASIWQNPLAEESPYYECRLKVQINTKQLTITNQPLKGIDITPTMLNTFSYSARIVYGNRVVSQNKYGLFLITWKAVNLKTLTSMVVGGGTTLTFTPAYLGFSYPEGFQVFCEASLWKCLALVTQDGKYVTKDGTDNVYVTCGTFG